MCECGFILNFESMTIAAIMAAFPLLGVYFADRKKIKERLDNYIRGNGPPNGRPDFQI